MSLIMSQTINQSHSSQAIASVLNAEVKNGSNGISARDKVLNNWKSGWKPISGSDSVPTLPNTELQPSKANRQLKAEANIVPRKELEPNEHTESKNESLAIDAITNGTTIVGQEETKTNTEVKNEFAMMFDHKEVVIKEVKKNRRRSKGSCSSDDSNKKLKISSDLSNVDKIIDSVIANITENIDEQPAADSAAQSTDVTLGHPILTNKQFLSCKPKSEAQKMIKKKVDKLKKSISADSSKLEGPKLKNCIRKKLNLMNVKRKLTRTRPVKVKKFFEQNSFLAFCEQKCPIKEGIAFIQNRSCNEFMKDNPDLTCCLDCNNDKKSTNTQTCRFYQYRTLIKNNGKLSVFGFAEEMKATFDDNKIWLPTSAPQNLDQISARYILTFAGQQFCKIFNSEKMAEEVISVTWKKPVKGIRELCDVCQTTIFNTHYVCPKCGLAVCIDCFSSRRRQINGQISRKNRDEYGWIFCNKKEAHDITKFHLARFITASLFASLNNVYHDIRNYEQIRGLCCERLRRVHEINLRDSCAFLDIKSLYPDVPLQLFSDNRLLLLLDPKCENNIKLFQIYWLRGYPVMIQNVDSSLKSELWTPNNFNSKFGKECSRLVNCMNGQILPKQPMCNFWDGFEDVSKRFIDQITNQEMILKLKDWPPNAEFRDKLPVWFDDLMDALPLKQYTRYNGTRNIASRLPDFFVRPDLGPKMYCAYGSVMHPDKGTTNLHLDMSDAVNVMIYVGIAQKDGQPLEEHLKEANNVLIKGGCDEMMMNRANDGRKVGALWHIWKAEDADKIRNFLHQVARERGERIESHTDPIHDQSWYLDENLRTRLEKEYNVIGVAIAQCLGDAILVPAGAPHQVQNIHSCIKVAGEFVSPENVAHCLAMTQQFRNLSKRHNNHEDKLQIKNIIYHTIKDCLYVLLPDHMIPKRPRLPIFEGPPPPNFCSDPTPMIASNCDTSSSQTPDNQMPPIIEDCPQPNPNVETETNVNIKDENSDQKEENVSETKIQSIGETSSRSPNSPILAKPTDISNADPMNISLPDLTIPPPLTRSPSVVVTTSLTDSLPPPPLLRPYSCDSDSEANYDPTKSCQTSL